METRKEKHLAKLRGDLFTSELIQINGVNCMVLNDFNVYAIFNQIKESAREKGRPLCTKELLPLFLEEDNYIKIIKSPLDKDLVTYSYTLFPFSVNVRDILKTIMIFTIEGGDDSIMEWTIRDVFLFTKIKGFLSNTKMEPNLSYVENVKRVINIFEERYVGNEAAFE